MNALKEEMPENFGRELLAQLKAEEKQKVKPFPTFWTVAVASIITVLVGFALFFSRMSNAAPLSLAQQPWQSREQLSPENINLAEPLLTIGSGYAEAIAVSLDGNTLAVGTSKGVYLHNAHDLAAEAVFLGLPADIEFHVGYDTYIEYMEFIPDGRLFVLIKTATALTLYQWTEDGGFTAVQAVAQPWLIAQAVDVSPDGTMLLIGACSMSYGMYGDFCADHALARIQVIDLVNGGNVFFRMPRRMSNALVAVNPDWTQLIFQEDNQIKLYDFASEEISTLLNIEPIGQLQTVMPWNEAHRLYFSPDGTKFGVLENLASPMDWWEISTLQAEPQTVPAFGDDFNDMDNVSPATALHPLRDEYVIPTSRGILAYEYFRGSPIATFDSLSMPVSLQISPDGQALYTLDMTGVLRRWDWESQSLNETNTLYTIGNISITPISMDSNLFVSGGYNASGLGYYFELSPTGIQQNYLYANDYNQMMGANTIISHDGRYIAFNENGALWLFDRYEQSRLQLSDSIQMRWLSFRTDGALISLIHLGDYVTVHVYTPEMLESGAVPPNNIFESIEGVPLHGLMFSPDGTKLLLTRCDDHDPMMPGCENPDIRLFDTFTWEEIGALQIENDAEETLVGYQFSNDSQWLFLNYCNGYVSEFGWTCNTNGYELDVWRVADIGTSPEPAIHVEGLDMELPSIMSVIPYPDGSFLIASWGYSYADAGQYEYRPNAIFWELEADGSFREIVRMEMRYVSFAPDGSYFLTGRDGQIELWGVPGGVASND